MLQVVQQILVQKYYLLANFAISDFCNDKIKYILEQEGKHLLF